MSSLISARSALDIPQPGHLSPVSRLIRHIDGISLFVTKSNSKASRKKIENVIIVCRSLFS